MAATSWQSPHRVLKPRMDTRRLRGRREQGPGVGIGAPEGGALGLLPEEEESGRRRQRLP